MLLQLLFMKYCLLIGKLLLIACMLVIVMAFGKSRSYNTVTRDMNGK
jgi:hypothetical protein